MQKSESSTTSESSSSLPAADGALTGSIPRDNKQPVEFIFDQPESAAVHLSRIKRLQYRITEAKARLRKLKQDILPGAMDLVFDVAQRERSYDNRTILVVDLSGGDNDNLNDWVDGGADADGNGMSPKMALLAFLAFLVETDWTWLMDLLD